MTTHKFHLCPKCSKKFTPKYKLASYTGGKEICPRCQKALQPPKQARSVLKLMGWAQEAGITFYLSKDVGSELLYVCVGRWKQFDASVDKVGRISISYCQIENTIVHDKRHFMELMQKHREYITGSDDLKK